MRPILRPAAPQVFTKYQDARDPLIDAIDDYCSYCEMPTSQAVEHVLPWDGKHQALKLVWSNFLLTCALCNNNKRSRQDSKPYGNTATARARYLWPDLDNTARAFEYKPSFDVVVNPAIPAAIRPIAVATHWMLGLEKQDRRWQSRKTTWTAANTLKDLLATAPSVEMREAIEIAAKRGHWSVWRAVFTGDADMLARFNRVFKGTDPSSFNPASGMTVPRPGGQL